MSNAQTPTMERTSVNDRRPLRRDRTTRLPTPAQWAARLGKFRKIVERSAELERLRERIRAIEARNEQAASERPTPPRRDWAEGEEIAPRPPSQRD